ncbi:hypothetical protein CLAFUW4_10658 [Fulvia fulva]|uniref:Uncharacterized protein n=1 Tax=Passalora fulva TaxID=5499 RepID=A0A9Q8LGB3_PASFU|nr:uncharacterized protein CLAFUR5_05271 [Fulvia fulva]KAK4616142.1 hypothetical protein CLAFUR4_10663 [Fulvia fulva]KAK4616390.1 hypothetical protein CLAFUR0_10580 [Fulvia fulva]UJO16970.1 hypothetical protein CLAFUR5_05271 [Fulvia fulva]WPV18873.1 hypothetical protein CLAFUW4_10658 [Fulvia fulva]WPV33937.1 hypothetical protein CLAFUW7_10660 [Fulvia fulva]
MANKRRKGWQLPKDSDEEEVTRNTSGALKKRMRAPVATFAKKPRTIVTEDKTDEPELSKSLKACKMHTLLSRRHQFGTFSSADPNATAQVVPSPKDGDSDEDDEDDDDDTYDDGDEREGEDERTPKITSKQSTWGAPVMNDKSRTGDHGVPDPTAGYGQHAAKRFRDMVDLTANSEDDAAVKALTPSKSRNSSFKVKRRRTARSAVDGKAVEKQFVPPKDLQYISAVYD